MRTLSIEEVRKARVPAFRPIRGARMLQLWYPGDRILVVLSRDRDDHLGTPVVFETRDASRTGGGEGWEHLPACTCRYCVAEQTRRPAGAEVA